MYRYTHPLRLGEEIVDEAKPAADDLEDGAAPEGELVAVTEGLPAVA